MGKIQKRDGQYRQLLLEQRGQRRIEEKEPVSFFRIRFYLCLCIFAAYVALDYTKSSIYSVNSNRIYTEIGRDLTAELDLEEAWTEILDSITKEIYIK